MSGHQLDERNRNELHTQGWDAIAKHLNSLYPNVEPKHWGTMVRFANGGPDPLDGVSAYEVTEGECRHLHFVSFGMSELYEKTSPYAEQSGWGYEFTMRVKQSHVDPIWTAVLFQELARYVYRTSNTFNANEHVDFQRPLTSAFDTEMTGLLIVEDGALGTIETSNGRVQFLQLYAVTNDELEAVKSWNLQKMIEIIKESSPQLVCDMQRGSVFNDATMRRKIREGIQKDGSSCTLYYFNEMRWNIGPDDSRTLLLTDREALTLQTLLSGRTMHGREALIEGAGGKIEVLPTAGEDVFEQKANADYRLELSKESVKELINLLSRKGQPQPLSAVPKLRVHVRA